MNWLELSVASRYPEFAEEALLANGAASVTLVDAEDHPVLEPLPGETPLWPHTIVRGLFLAPAEIDAAAQALREQLPDGATLVLTTRTIEDADWVGAWLQHARPMRFGAPAVRGLWICPSGHAVEEAGAVVVQLDPGLAFGTGTHPSTALCLEWLANQAEQGATVLDFGCGSGILAIAALKLGARHVEAIDIDPQALTATQDNAVRNGVEPRLRIASVDDVSTQDADLVLANILATPLITLAPVLAARTRLGGHIVLAGLLDEQADAVREAYAPWFDFEADGRRDGWSRVSGARRR